MGKSIGHTSVYQNLESLAKKSLVECVDRSDGMYGSPTNSHFYVYHIEYLGIYINQISIRHKSISISK